MRRRLRGAIVGTAVVAAAILPLTTTGAQTPVPTFRDGATWWSDNDNFKTVPSGSLASAYATEARPGKSYVLHLVRPHPDVPCSDTFGRTVLNPNARVANTRGFIPYTSGRVTGTPGLYHACFFELPLVDGRYPSHTFPAFVWIE